MQPHAKIPRLEITPADIVVKVLVTPHAAGKIIGRGGGAIAELRKQYGVGCHIQGPEHMLPSGEQIAVLFGSRMAIDTAFPLVVGKLAEANEIADPSQPFTVTVLMTCNAVSGMIGTKGATISSLRKESGCSISAEKDPIGGEQLVRVTGGAGILPGALALLTPFVENSGDSAQFLTQDAGKGMAATAAKGCGKGLPAKGKNTWSSGGMGKGATDWSSGGMGKGASNWSSGGMGKGPAAWQGGNSWGPRIAPLKRHLESTDGTENTSENIQGDAESKASSGYPALAEQAPLVAPEEDPVVLGSETSIAFPVPGPAIGRVLGKGGSSAANIRNATGVALRIDPGEVEGTCVLSGTLSAVHRAHCMVVGRIQAEHWIAGGRFVRHASASAVSAA
eukprot:CAMPEP_0117557602 /NCGR_PEP_ID=MMETSP0784-20121206/52410_1 /TAXON_ID=39447 /ORGANISM="" /LENGTH=391 /DNA_ID=CAMNT_0005354915 /DNA_START=80 /DNA_END=1254 /DNA_ORIENTATION=-